uniref:Salivary gland protein Salp16 Iper-1 n=1 Tax=Ixodes persulcatus TaxID=34615 RepID=R4WWV4_IXOPE|nr:salivary gland protein Salp16 Iper-1 [Ixodes persulcatus]
MFKLKLFILFALAGLCFGDTSASGTVGGSSGNEASSDNQKKEQDTEATNGQTSDGNDNDAQTSGGRNNEAQTSEGQNNKGDIQKKKIGDHLPGFIGNDTDKVSYLNKLLSVCNKKHNLHKINKVNITFEKCTFVCLSEGITATNQEERIPTGLLCNSGGGTCPKEGSCPKLPLPSC